MFNVVVTRMVLAVGYMHCLWSPHAGTGMSKYYIWLVFRRYDMYVNGRHSWMLF